MDPLSLVGTILGIVSVVAKATLSLSDLQSRYKIADLKVTLLIGQLSTLKAALTQVRCLVENVSLGSQLVDDLAISLSSLGTIIGTLGNQLDQLQLNAENGLSKWAKVSFVWDEQTMRDYLSLLDHQVNALQLLLSALQCRTIFEQSDMLSTRESRDILQLARDETSSMRWLTDTESNSIAGTLRSVETQDLETLNSRFDFDSEVFTSRAYMAASRANMIDALRGAGHNEIFHSTEITGGPPRDSSIINGSNDISTSGIALTTVLDVVTDSASESLPPLPEDNITERQASRTRLVRASDSNAGLPDFMIHTPETLGLLALELGLPAHPLNMTLPTTERRVRGGGVSKLSTRAPLLLRPKKQLEVPAPMTIAKVHNCEVTKILILGISESGKSTLAKTMRAAHGDISESWLWEYRTLVLSNVMLSLKWLLRMAEQLEATHGGSLGEIDGVEDADAFSASVRVMQELEDDAFLPTSLARLGAATRYLWNHPRIREVFESSGTAELHGEPAALPGQWDSPLYLPDCAEYFLNSTDRVFQEDYVPSLEDVLWTHTKTTGTWESKFVINGRTYQLFDVGGARPERKKWINAFENVSMVIFTVDLSCYHQVLNEDMDANRMEEQFQVWQAIANSHWFSSARIAVLLTKEDKLTPDRLRRHPFGATFPDFPGDPESAGDIIKYIIWRLDGLISRQENFTSGRVKFCRSGTISESLEVWEKLLSMAGDSF